MLQQSPPDISRTRGPSPAGTCPGAGEAWRPGQIVVLRGDRWRLNGGRRFTDCHLLMLTGTTRTNRGRHLAVLQPFDRPRSYRRLTRLRRVKIGRWLNAFRGVIGSATPFGRLRTAARARIDLLPYQIAPALAILNGDGMRLLLADEVGLGKTIQAGLVISELQAIDQAARTLVLVPAGLRDQWRNELHERFGIDAVVADAAAVRVAVSQVAAGINPWSTWPVAIASVDFVKRPAVLRALAPLSWDVLLVDEAHTCSLAPERSAAVQSLAARARYVLLLTATPHAGDDRAFAALAAIGQAGREDAIAMFRRSRHDVGLPSNRRVHLHRVAPNAAERRMHALLAQYTSAVWNGAEASTEARLAMIVLRKRALSSAFSLVRSLERRRDALFDGPGSFIQLALPFPGQAEADEQTPEDDEAAGPLGAPGMQPARERAWLTRLLAAARHAAERESKLARLCSLLSRVRAPAIVFTEYRDTARHLAATLEPLGPVALLHGALSRAERHEAERAFRSGRARVLVATDAAGEGLNLQQRCRLVINLELPWNPMRLEQRIGRVDRLGQQRRVHAVHLLGSGTAEEQIVARLVVRQLRAREVVGGTSDAIGAREDDVARAVMTGDIAAKRLPPDGGAPGAAPPVRRVESESLCREEIDRLLAIRRLRGQWCDSPHHGLAEGTIWFANRRGGHRIVCLFSVRAIDGRDETLEDMVVALEVRLAVPAPQIDRRTLEAIAGSPALQQRARSCAETRLDALRALHTRRVTAATSRERALAPRRPPGGRAVQPGMFDRRALERAQLEDRLEAARAGDREARLLDLAVAASNVSVADPELLLVLA